MYIQHSVFTRVLCSYLVLAQKVVREGVLTALGAASVPSGARVTVSSGGLQRFHGLSQLRHQDSKTLTRLSLTGSSFT